MSKSNVFNFKDIDDVNTGFQNTSGWFKKLQTSSSKSNRELDRHPILRLKNVDDLNAVSGVIRFNEEKLGGPVFEGYDGLEWTSFNNTQGLTGKDGINYKTVVDGNNLSNSSDSKSDYYPLFKNVIESNIKTDTIKDDTIESKVSATIHKLPTFKYDSNYTNKQFNLSNHNIIFEPNDTNSYKVIVNKNDSWPPVDYSTHEKYSSTNSNVKLSSNNYFWKNLPSKFNFYNNEYETVYINENGYLTFGIGESAFVQNLLANHFSKSRISALFLNLTNDTEDTNQGSFTVGDSDIFIGTGKYNEYVITFQNYIHNPGTINYRVDFQIRLFLNDVIIDPNNLFSDDYYKKGTIQISYNNNINLENISPIIGLSNGSGYNTGTFTELYFSNLLTSDKRVATTETGMPFLRTFMSLQLSSTDTTSKTNLNTGYSTTNDAINKQETGSIYYYKLVLDDLDHSDMITIKDGIYGTSFTNGVNYIKTINLGDVKVQKLAIAIRSDFDYEKKNNNLVIHYSDSTNYFIDKTSSVFPRNTSLDRDWTSIPVGNFVDISNIYSSTSGKDYFNIYDNKQSNSNYQSSLYNSKIHRIQAKYENYLDMTNPSIPTLKKNLIIKIIYNLSSDLDNNTGTSIANPRNIIFDKNVNDNDNDGPYHIINNDVDYFSIGRDATNLDIRFKVSIYDYLMTPETSEISDLSNSTISRRSFGENSNQSLTLELLNSNGTTLITNKPSNIKIIETIDNQQIKLFNQIIISDPSTEQYYLKISGANKLGYYGISLLEHIDESSGTQIYGKYSDHKFTRIPTEITDSTCNYNNSTIITIDSTLLLAIGMVVSGTGIPTGATISSITDSTKFELSAPTTGGSVTNETLTFSVLPLTISNPISGNNYSITTDERIYSITKSNNMVFLVSDNTVDNIMKIYNYDFDGIIKTNYPITTGYSTSENILDIQFLKNGDSVDQKVLVARMDSSSNIIINLFDLSVVLSSSNPTSIQKPAITQKYTYLRTFTDTEGDYILLILLDDSYYLNLNAIKGDAVGEITNTTVGGLTSTLIINEIVNVIVFDKDNIFIVGNNTNTNTAKIIKLKLNLNTSTNTYVYTHEGSIDVANGQTVNKILYAEKYEVGDNKAIIVFYQEGLNAENGYCISSFDLDFIKQNNKTFEYNSIRVTTLNNIIFNFKVKRDMILILWQDANENRLFQSYKIQLSDSTEQILKVKTSIVFPITSYLMDVDIQNIIINGQTENTYIIIHKYLDDVSQNFQLLISIEKEYNNNTIIQFISDTKYLQNLDFGSFTNTKSIFNTTATRKFQVTNEFNKLIKTPLPITGTENNEQLFFFGFDTDKKLILEGFGKFSDVTDTGTKVSSTNEIKTVGTSTLDTPTQLSFTNIESFNASTKEFGSAVDELSFDNRLLPYDLFDSNSFTLEPNLKIFETSMRTMKQTIGGITTYFTGVIHGPTTLTYSGSGAVDSYQKINGTFNFDIYTGDEYKKKSFYTLTASIASININPYSQALEVIPITDGFLIYGFFIYYFKWVGTKMELHVSKFIVDSSGNWEQTDSGDLSRNQTIVYGGVADPFPSIRHELIDSGSIAVISIKTKGNYTTNDVQTNSSGNSYYFFLNIADLTWSIGHSLVDSADTDYPSVLPKFSNNIHNIHNITATTYPTLSSGSRPVKFRGLMENIYFNHDSKHLLYILEYGYIGPRADDHGISIYKCVRNGTDDSDTKNRTLYAEKYFDSANVSHKLITGATGATGDNKIDVSGTLWGSGEGVLETTNYNGYAPLKYLFTNNVTYKDANNEFHIYFMGDFKPEYINIEGTYHFINADLTFVSNSINSNIKCSYSRIMKLTISYSAATSSETYVITNAHSFTWETVTSGNVTTLGDTFDKESLITQNSNLAQFNIIMDDTTRYIIASSHGTLYNSNNTYIGQINREKVDFIIYKIKDDDTGDLELVCWGKQQRILGINIESRNLVLFVPVNDSGVVSDTGKFTKVFKKPISDIIAGSEIILSSFVPTIKEPNNDTNNTLNYPQFFTNITNGSKFIYNGAAIYDNNIFPTNSAPIKQDNAKNYNMVVGYSPSSDYIGYEDPKSFNIITFGSFSTSTSGSSGSSGGGGIESTSIDVSISDKLLHFNNQNGDSTNSNFIIGRYKDTIFNSGEDDTGIVFYSYNNPVSLPTDTKNFYIRTNSIPNYEPIYKGKIIKGTWNNELGDSDYSIMAQDYGWLTPVTLTSNGTYFKIPHTITTATQKNILVGTSNISETFWFIGDTNWDAIMVNPGYFDSTASQVIDSNGYYITNTTLVSTSVNDKLLTPIGRIGSATNGVMFYNYSNLERTKNAVKELKGDIFGGMGDSLNAYHYHSWPVNLEGMLDLGHPDPNIQSLSYNRLPSLLPVDKYTLTAGSETFPKYIYGMTYYFNQIDRSNYDSVNSNNNAIKFEPIFKDTIYRYKVKQESNEYWLSPIDFSGAYTTSTPVWTRRMVLSKVKQGDTIIFNHDATCTQLITITSDETTPTTVASSWNNYNNVTINVVIDPETTANIKTSTISQIGPVSTDGSLTYFNVPYNFDIKYYRYQPSGIGGVDRGSFIITGSFYEYNVNLLGSETNKYYTLTPVGGDILSGTTSPTLRNIKFGDLVLFDQTALETDYYLKIKTTNINILDTNNDDANFQHTIVDKLFFIPKNAFSLTTNTLYYNANKIIAGVTLIGGSIISGKYTRPTEYTFNNSLVRHGTPGNSYCPYTKFTIPTFSDIKVNYLTLKYNSTTTKYEFYGTLNSNYYSQSTTNLLTNLKLFIDTKYIITVDSTVNTTSKVPKFSATSASYEVYNFEYKGENTFVHDTTNNLLTFTVGAVITNLYLYNSDDTNDTTIGSTYNGTIQSSRSYNLLDKIRLTDLNADASNDVGSNLSEQSLLSNKIVVKVSESKYVFFGKFNSLDYYETGPDSITDLKLFNNTKYEFDISDSSMSGKKLKFSTDSTTYTANNITFNDTYDDSDITKISLIVSGLTNQTTIYAYDGSDTTDITIKGDATIKNHNPKPINIYTKVTTTVSGAVTNTKLEFYKNPTIKSYFNGYMDYESALDYITKKLTRVGPSGHSPILGYAFDGFPIYGPLGYNISDSSYDGDATILRDQTLFKVKLLLSSYTGGNDNDGNPIYIKGSGDLDICNGITSITPEFPNGIFHYICTIEVNTDGTPKLLANTKYGYLNESTNIDGTPKLIVTPAYPYIIGAYKGIPDKSNFNTKEVTTLSTTSSIDNNIKYTMNFRSLKTSTNKFNGINFSSLDINSDDNYLELRPKPHPYIWNFTNDISEDSFFGKSNKEYGNSITNLKSSISDSKFKAYGTVSKWVCKGVIYKGLAVRLVNNSRTVNINGSDTIINTLEIELYDSRTSPNEVSKGSAFLGIALNDSGDMGNCFVCTKGITTIKIGNSLNTINCGSYGTLVFSTLKGYVVGVSAGNPITDNTAIAGYFLEDLPHGATGWTDDVEGDIILFNVQGNYEFQ